MNCTSKAKKLWPKAIWIDGVGEYASVAHCRGTTVRLFETEERANKAKAQIDDLGCGGGCSGNHEVVALTVSKP